jgi:hypothetical protein
MGNTLAEYNSKLLREILAAVFIEQLIVKKKMLEVDYEFIGQVTDLLNWFKEYGQLNPDISVPDLEDLHAYYDAVRAKTWKI